MSVRSCIKRTPNVYGGGVGGAVSTQKVSLSRSVKNYLPKKVSCWGIQEDLTWKRGRIMIFDYLSKPDLLELLVPMTVVVC
jgi:hypothetical protein